MQVKEIILHIEKWGVIFELSQDQVHNMLSRQQFLSKAMIENDMSSIDANQSPRMPTERVSKFQATWQY